MDNGLRFYKISSIKRILGKARVYNFDVPGYETYVANGIGVHNCQNFEISQVGKGAARKMEPSEAVALAVSKGCSGIAFTYSEPLVLYEYVIEVSKLAKEAGLRTVLKTNCFLNEAPFVRVMRYVDAINVDVKGDAKGYKDVCGIDLPEDPTEWCILRNLRMAMTMGKHCEVSHIVLPPLCDDYDKQERLLSALAYMTGRKLPLHLLKFIPDFRMRDQKPTTDDQLSKVFVSAMRHFRYVYIDYAGKPTDTVCDKCGTMLVRRQGIVMIENRLATGALCPRCQASHDFVM